MVTIEDVLGLFCEGSLPFEIKVRRLNDLSDEEWIEFENFVDNNKKLSWLTPLSVMEAVDSILVAL